jgi:predicted nuclease of predicted toxin-antitoxin system
MRFLIDAQLPPALARLLSSGGYHAEHVANI